MCKSFKWCHQMLQNDVIKCCKMMSPHSNEPATWRNCVSRRRFFHFHGDREKKWQYHNSGHPFKTKNYNVSWIHNLSFLSLLLYMTSLVLKIQTLSFNPSTIVYLQQKHIDAVMKPAGNMRHRVAYSEDLKQFIDGRWSIGGSGRGKGGWASQGRAPPLGPIFFIFMQFFENFVYIIDWSSLPHPSLGNPVSATVTDPPTPPPERAHVRNNLKCVINYFLSKCCAHTKKTRHM